MRTGFSAEDESVLVLYDGSEPSISAIAVAIDLLRPGNTLHILMLPQVYGDDKAMADRLAMLIPRIC